MKLVQLKVVFTASAAPADWQRLVDETGLSRSGAALPTVLPVASFTALPDTKRAKGMYLLGGMRRAKPTSNVDVIWSLELTQAPDESPPDDALERSERVGGYPRVLESLHAAWPAATRNFEAHVTASYELAGWKLKLPEPTLPKRPVSIRGVRFVEDAAMRFWHPRPSFHGFVSLNVIRAAKFTILSLFGTRGITLGKDLFTDLEAQTWENCRSLLRT